MATTPTNYTIKGLNGRTQHSFSSVSPVNVYRYINDAPTLVATGVSTKWIDFGIGDGELVNGTVYTYQITAVDGGGESDPTSPVTVTPVGQTRTKFPFRQSLLQALRFLILTDAVPAINTQITAQLSVPTGGTLVQFGDATVVSGDMYAIAQPTICVWVSGSRITTTPGAGIYNEEFATNIDLRLPAAGANKPEDFSLVSDIVLDTVGDLLTSLQNYYIYAFDPATGQPQIDGSSIFSDCRVVNTMRFNRPEKDAGNVTRMPAWTILHHAQIQYTLARANAIGG